MTEVIIGIGDATAFAFHSLIAAVKSLLKPVWVGRPFYDAFLGGLPLAFVAGLAVGAVVWIHTRGVLARTSPGAVEYLPTFLAAAVLLELAPIAAGLIAASRTGASIGAELSSMKLGEQIDAMQLIGVSPILRLVGPRVLSSILATPLLHVVVACVALGGGFLAESLAGQTTWLRYRASILSELRFADILLAGLKPAVFGALVGITGCFAGLRAVGGSEGVGKAATRAVVASSLLVLVADVVLVGLIRMIVG